MMATLSITDCVSAGAGAEAAAATETTSTERLAADESSQDDYTTTTFQHQPLGHPQTVRRQRTHQDSTPGSSLARLFVNISYR